MYKNLAVILRQLCYGKVSFAMLVPGMAWTARAAKAVFKAETFKLVAAVALLVDPSSHRSEDLFRVRMLGIARSVIGNVVNLDALERINFKLLQVTVCSRNYIKVFIIHTRILIAFTRVTNAHGPSPHSTPWRSTTCDCNRKITSKS